MANIAQVKNCTAPKDHVHTFGGPRWPRQHDKLDGAITTRLITTMRTISARADQPKLCETTLTLRKSSGGSSR